MMPAPAQPLFLGQGESARFGLYHAPAAPDRCRGALLYLHPWAEEMNKARRMAALQARALAAAGWAVLQLDLHGCGDSAGDFADASWNSWRADVARGLDWLQATLGPSLPQAPGLWGLRLGALLALDYAARPAGRAPSRLLLWQPVLQGASHLTQFLRLRVAAQMLGDAAHAADGGTNALRATLAAGSPLEIAGYTLSPDLAAALDQLDASRLRPPCQVQWLEVVAAEGRPLPPAAQRVLQAWQHADCRAQTVAGPQFWATQEIAEAPALLEATRAALLEACHA